MKMLDAVDGVLKACCARVGLPFASDSSDGSTHEVTKKVRKRNRKRAHHLQDAPAVSGAAVPLHDPAAFDEYLRKCFKEREEYEQKAWQQRVQQGGVLLPELRWKIRAVPSIMKWCVKLLVMTSSLGSRLGSRRENDQS